MTLLTGERERERERDWEWVREREKEREREREDEICRNKIIRNFLKENFAVKFFLEYIVFIYSPLFRGHTVMGVMLPLGLFKHLPDPWQLPVPYQPASNCSIKVLNWLYSNGFNFITVACWAVCHESDPSWCPLSFLELNVPLQHLAPERDSNSEDVFTKLSKVTQCSKF